MPISSHKQPLFGGALHTLVSDRSAGIVHPDHPDFAQRIDELRAESGADVILAQALEMKTGIADLRAGAPLEAGKVPGFIRTKDKADGVIFPAGGIEVDQVRKKTAALLMVGDSPGVTVYDMDNDVIGFLNGSMECLDPADGGDGIVTKLLAMLKATGSDPRSIRMAVSACAQACCFGYDMSTAQNAPRHARLTGRYGADVITPAITYPPRTGNGIDLPLIAKRQAELAGVDPAHVTIDPLCTSHDGVDLATLTVGMAVDPAGQGRFYSGVRGATMGAKQTPPVKWNQRGAMMVWA
ncbi:MAG TPA: laccase domain-containing protein [Candidatus Peribacteria bacterium]|nr:laccase domain-containing protein [Candidatus Peribacteria bacterium]